MDPSDFEQPEFEDSLFWSGAAVSPDIGSTSVTPWGSFICSIV
jgi:hypothetical protein